MTANIRAPRPPMGWNSYDCYGLTVTETQVRENAVAMTEKLAPSGYQYIVIDHQWYNPHPPEESGLKTGEITLDAFGRILPAVNRFPSSADDAGLAPLADALHEMGLKLGVHIMRGIPRQAVHENLPIHNSKYRAADVADTSATCPWCDDMYGLNMAHPGAQDWYDSVAALLAQWGVDFIKADDIAAPHYYADDIAALSRTIEKAGREIVLSLSPGDGADVSNLAHLQAHAQMLRTSPDVWDKWDDVRRQFDTCRRWMGLAACDAWPDADMLPVGRIGMRGVHRPDRSSRLTHDEQQTLMTLWCIFRSPLFIGGDLPSLDAWTLRLLTHPPIIAMNQTGINAREIWRDENRVIWASDTADGRGHYVAFFNLHDEQPLDVTLPLSQLGVPGPLAVRDMWTQQDLPRVQNVFSRTIPPHGCGCYLLSETFHC